MERNIVHAVKVRECLSEQIVDNFIEFPEIEKQHLQRAEDAKSTVRIEAYFILYDILTWKEARLFSQ